MKTRHTHHHKKKFQLSGWIKHNKKLVLVILIVLIFLFAFLIDRKTK